MKKGYGQKFRIAFLIAIGIFLFVIGFYQFIQIPLDEDDIFFIFAYATSIISLLFLYFISEIFHEKFDRFWINRKIFHFIWIIFCLAIGISSLYLAYGFLRNFSFEEFFGGLLSIFSFGALAYGGFYGVVFGFRNLFSDSNANVLEKSNNSIEKKPMENISSANKYHPISIPTIISIVMLLIGIPEIFPYSYYLFLRIVVCGTSGYIAYVAFEMEKRIIGFISIFLVIIFNPLFVVHLEKGLWIIIALIVAIFFGTTIFFLKTKTFYADNSKTTKQVALNKKSLSEDMEWCQMGYEYILEKRYDLAKECMEEALKINPENAFALLNMGTIYTFEGENEQAVKLYEKVIALNSNDVAKSCTDKYGKGRKIIDIAIKNLEEMNYLAASHEVSKS